MPDFHGIIFLKVGPKLSHFAKKIQNFRALGAPPPDLRAFGGLRFCPQTPSLRRQEALLPDPPIAAGGRGLRPQTPETALTHCRFLATRRTPIYKRASIS